jgi:hypothetical protein
VAVGCEQDFQDRLAVLHRLDRPPGNQALAPEDRVPQRREIGPGRARARGRAKLEKVVKARWLGNGGSQEFCCAASGVRC